jgi:flagellar biosynthesis/type III secretory pathway protein FliH
MALSDWTSGVNYARREGRAEGRKEGMVEGRKEGIAEGRKEGRVEGRKEGAQEFLDLLVQGKTIEEAKRMLNLE